MYAFRTSSIEIGWWNIIFSHINPTSTYTWMNHSKAHLINKHSFRNLNFYSMPFSILFIVRKRLNLVFFLIINVLALIWIL